MTTRWEKTAVHDDPELVGAQWWRTAIDERSDGTSRRSALLSLAGLAAAGMTVGGALGATGCGPSEPQEIELTKQALELQKEFGWDVGSSGQPLGFPPDLTVGDPGDPAVLDTLVERMQPTNPAHAPFYLPVLFQSLTATPTTPAGTPGAQLRDQIRAVDSPAIQDALSQGRGLATLFEAAPPGRAIIVDMPGHQAVAFAAGLADRFDPVFVMDNWPHPQGVVPSHVTLATLLTMLPEFEAATLARPATAPPVFVLDANRLAPFDETGTRFDNRHLAILPTASQMRSLGIRELLYVRPGATDQELDDLNADFVDWRENGVEVRLVPADTFRPPAPDDSEPKLEASATPAGEVEEHYATTRVHHQHHWYGSPMGHWFFWSHYGWGTSRYRTSDPGFAAPTWTARTRPTIFSTPSGSKRAPSGFGSVSVKQKAGSSPSLTPRSSSSKSTGTFGRGSGGRTGA